MKQISFDVSSWSLASILSFLYKGVADIALQDGPELLRFAHMHGLHSFGEHVACGFRSRLNAHLSLDMLVECELLGYDELAAECERYVVEHFQESATCSTFVRLPASQLGSFLKHEALTVANEESVLEAVLAWHAAEPGRDDCCRMLLQQVRFPLMALQSLRAVEKHA
jgi:hypothetical protein